MLVYANSESANHMSAHQSIWVLRLFEDEFLKFSHNIRIGYFKYDFFCISGTLIFTHNHLTALQGRFSEKGIYPSVYLCLDRLCSNLPLLYLSLLPAFPFLPFCKIYTCMSLCCWYTWIAPPRGNKSLSYSVPLFTPNINPTEHLIWEKKIRCRANKSAATVWVHGWRKRNGSSVVYLLKWPASEFCSAKWSILRVRTKKAAPLQSSLMEAAELPAALRPTVEGSVCSQAGHTLLSNETNVCPSGTRRWRSKVANKMKATLSVPATDWFSVFSVAICRSGSTFWENLTDSNVWPQNRRLDFIESWSWRWKIRAKDEAAPYVTHGGQMKGFLRTFQQTLMN